MDPIDTSALPVATQLQLSQLSMVSSEMSSLEPSSDPADPFGEGDATSSLFSSGVYLDLSPEAQAMLAGDTASAPEAADAAPGAGWELGYYPQDSTDFDLGPKQG